MTNEPTTGELVEQLHTFDNVDAVTITIAKAALLFIADRLESQERENASLRAENKGLHEEIIRRGIEIKTMTARAEQAEAFVKCSECKKLTVLNTESVYAKCHKRGITFFPFDIDTRRMGCMDGKRGLPQEGEGKNDLFTNRGYGDSVDAVGARDSKRNQPFQAEQGVQRIL